jgi:hypothetical protein
MPFSTYLPEHIGSATLNPPGPFIAGSHVDLTLTYTAGTFGIDDTGIVKISWRTTSDMGKPQFTDPSAANYTTVEASNGAKLDVWFDRLNMRPWANTILIRVGRGYLRHGDTLTVRLGDRRQGSPGYRLQTNCEERFELKTCIDAFAAYEFCEPPRQPAFDFVPGPARRWKAIWPSLAVAGESFRLAIIALEVPQAGLPFPGAMAAQRRTYLRRRSLQAACGRPHSRALSARARRPLEPGEPLHGRRNAERPSAIRSGLRRECATDLKDSMCEPASAVSSVEARARPAAYAPKRGQPSGRLAARRSVVAVGH